MQPSDNATKYQINSGNDSAFRERPLIAVAGENESSTASDRIAPDCSSVDHPQIADFALASRLKIPIFPANPRVVMRSIDKGGPNGPPFLLAASHSPPGSSRHGLFVKNGAEPSHRTHYHADHRGHGLRARAPDGCRRSPQDSTGDGGAERRAEHVARRLHPSLAGDLGGDGRRGPDRGRLFARSLLAGHRSAAD